MSSVNITDSTIDVTGSDGKLRFTLDKTYPIVTFDKTVTGSGYVQTYLFLSTTNSYSFGSVGTIDVQTDIKLATYGVDYTTVPDFFTANIALTDNAGTRYGTLNGSYLVLGAPMPMVYPYADYVIDLSDTSPDFRAPLGVSYVLSLFMDANNDIILRRRIIKADHLVTEERYTSTSTTGIMYRIGYTNNNFRNEYASTYVRTDGIFKLYRYSYSYDIKLIIGSFAG